MAFIYRIELNQSEGLSHGPLNNSISMNVRGPEKDYDTFRPPEETLSPGKDTDLSTPTIH